MADLLRMASITELITALVVKACAPIIVVHSSARLILMGVLNKPYVLIFSPLGVTCKRIWKHFHQGFHAVERVLFNLGCEETARLVRFYKASHFNPANVSVFSFFFPPSKLDKDLDFGRESLQAVSSASVSSSAAAHTDPRAPPFCTCTASSVNWNLFLCSSSFCFCFFCLDGARGHASKAPKLTDKLLCRTIFASSRTLCSSLHLEKPPEVECA